MRMKLIGKKTYLVGGTIVTLALCQRFLGLVIPTEVWLALFALLGIALRAAIEGK